MVSVGLSTDIPTSFMRLPHDAIIVLTLAVNTGHGGESSLHFLLSLLGCDLGMRVTVRTRVMTVRKMRMRGEQEE